MTHKRERPSHTPTLSADGEVKRPPRASAPDDLPGYLPADRLGTMLTMLPVAMVTTTPEGTVSGWNAVAERLFGWSADAVRGSLPPYYGRRDASAWDDLARRALHGEPIREIEMRAMNHTGSTVDVLVAAAPLVDDHGANIGLLWLFVDLVAPKLAARMRTDALRKSAMAERGIVTANRAKANFLANMSHELRTPLNAVIGFSAMMADEMFGPLQPPRYRDYARNINQSGRHLLGIVNDILDVTNAEDGGLTLVERYCRIDRILAEAAESVGPKAEAKHLSVELELAEGLPSVWVDPGRLRQAVLSLLSNAVKFTPAGGRIRIEARREIPGALRITVRDNGIGMAPDDVPRAFERFTQFDAGLDRRFEGTGLGLPLARTLVELHGGTIVVESAPGVGTACTITLPPERLATIGR